MADMLHFTHGYPPSMDSRIHQSNATDSLLLSYILFGRNLVEKLAKHEDGVSVLTSCSVHLSFAELTSVPVSRAALCDEPNHGYFVFRAFLTSHINLHLLDSVGILYFDHPWTPGTSPN